MRQLAKMLLIVVAESLKGVNGWNGPQEILRDTLSS